MHASPHTERAPGARPSTKVIIYHTLVERVSGPTIGAGLIVCRARAGRAPHTRRAVGVPRTTQRRAQRAPYTIGARQARAQPSTSRKKEKDFGRLERQRERKRLVESVSGSRKVCLHCIAGAPGTRLTQHSAPSTCAPVHQRPYITSKEKARRNECGNRSVFHCAPQHKGARRRARPSTSIYTI